MLLVVTAFTFAAGCADNKDVNNKAAENKSWTFAVMGDTRSTSHINTGVNDVAVRAIAEDIVKNGCDLVLVVGDMVIGDTISDTPVDKQFENWKNSMSPVYSLGIKVYTVRGNHEYNNSSNVENDYVKTLGIYNPDNGPEGEKYLTYSFTHKNAFFLGLDEYANNHTHRVNQNWVNSQLANNSQPYIFVFGHEPAFKREHDDCLGLYHKDRNEFWNSIGKAGGHVYFCGHDHFYDRALVQDDFGHGIYQVIDGCGGAPFEKLESPKNDENSKFKLKYHNDIDYGYSLVTVKGNDVKIEWKALSTSDNHEWVTKDSFQMSQK
jgi:hypothetical protein